MKNVVLALVALASLGMSRPGCGPYKPDRDRDGEEKPPKGPEICKKLAGECSSSCFNREASYSCAQCCTTNFTLCDFGEKYDFAPCELIDPAPAPLPDAGPITAGSNTAPGKAPPAGSTPIK